MPNKKLYRSQTNKLISGVCGGLAEFLDIDPTVLRLIWVLVVVFSGFFPGVLVYFVAAIIVPIDPSPTAPPPSTNTPQS